MLIKYYATDGSVHLIEDVKDVSISKPSDECMNDDKLYKLVTFALKKQSVKTLQGILSLTVQDGICILYVYGTAYICNNDGKTLEKVIPVEVSNG